MSDLTKFKAKVCLTAGGCLIHEGKTLLIKHKKLGVWLCPGGHIDPDELPHQAAEREFWEETGVKVKAKPFGLMISLKDSEQVPAPFSCNLHWVCKKNYDMKIKSPKNYGTQKNWKRGCEQHANMLYLVEPTGSLDFKENVEETDGIAWFSLAEMKELDTYDQIKEEVEYAFSLV